MLCLQVSADGTFLCLQEKLFMVVYKSKNIYIKWIYGDPVNNVYDCTKTGWFNAWPYIWNMVFQAVCSIQSWFIWTNSFIWDNLGSQFSSRVLEYSSKNSIFFIYLSPNSTHTLHMSTIRCCSVQASKNRMMWHIRHVP